MLRSRADKSWLSLTGTVGMFERARGTSAKGRDEVAVRQTARVNRIGHGPAPATNALAWRSRLVSLDAGVRDEAMSFEKNSTNSAAGWKHSATPWQSWEPTKRPTMAVGGGEARAPESLVVLAGLSHSRGDRTGPSPTWIAPAAKKGEAAQRGTRRVALGRSSAADHLQPDLPAGRNSSEHQTPARACAAEQLWRDLRPKNELGRLPARARRAVVATVARERRTCAPRLSASDPYDARDGKNTIPATGQPDIAVQFDQLKDVSGRLRPPSRSMRRRSGLNSSRCGALSGSYPIEPSVAELGRRHMADNRLRFLPMASPVGPRPIRSAARAVRFRITYVLTAPIPSSVPLMGVPALRPATSRATSRACAAMGPHWSARGRSLAAWHPRKPEPVRWKSTNRPQPSLSGCWGRLPGSIRHLREGLDDRPTSCLSSCIASNADDPR